MNESISSDLGPLLSEHRITAFRAKGNYYAGIFLVVAGVLGIIIGFFISRSDPSILPICGGISLLIALGGGYSIWQSRSEQDLAIRAFRDGLTYTHKGKTEAMRWDEMSQVTMSLINNKNVRSIFYNYVLRSEDGRKITFNYNDKAMQNIQQLSDTIQREITNRQLPKAIAAYNAGNTVTFGSLTVSKNGISNGKETIPWHDVDEVKLQQGALTIRKKDKWLNWSSVTVGSTPNIYVFLNMVDQIVGVNKPKV
ncbi:MAG: hypothetical protein H6658_00785 [Ardenticatenaceae bacterium]|nr:hypothetical protein [Ardenticatenaceae bacterium]